MSLQSIFFSPQRGVTRDKYTSTGGISRTEDDEKETEFFELDGVIEEQHRNVIKLTQHPIEYGTQIADHAIRQPLVIRVQGIITNSPSLKQLGNEIPGYQGYVNTAVESFTNARIRTAYKSLIEIQNERRLMILQTGLLNYKNMVLTKVSTPNNIENNLMLDMTFTEAIVTSEEDTDGEKGYQLTTATSETNYALLAQSFLALAISGVLS